MNPSSEGSSSRIPTLGLLLLFTPLVFRNSMRLGLYNLSRAKPPVPLKGLSFINGCPGIVFFRLAITGRSGEISGVTDSLLSYADAPTTSINVRLSGNLLLLSVHFYSLSISVALKKQKLGHLFRENADLLKQGITLYPRYEEIKGPKTEELKTRKL